MNAFILWLLRVLRIGPTCHLCEKSIVPAESAVPVTCTTRTHVHFLHAMCALTELQRIAAREVTKPEARA